MISLVYCTMGSMSLPSSATRMDRTSLGTALVSQEKGNGLYWMEFSPVSFMEDSRSSSGGKTEEMYGLVLRKSEFV